MRVIELTVAPDGGSRVETKGYAGSDCQTASRFLEAALGRRTAEQLTADFYAAPTTQTQEVRP